MWHIDARCGGMNQDIAEAVQKTVENQHWKRAAAQYCGTGLELGPDLHTNVQLLRKPKGDPQTRGLAELISKEQDGRR